MTLTTDAKRLLAETIRGTAQGPSRGLRHRLLEAIKNEAAGRYRLTVGIKDAGLDEAHRRRRERLEAYLEERTRATKPRNAAEASKTRERLLRAAEKEAAATLVNRLVTLRLLEARGLSRPPILTGGWNSKGYAEFREFAPGLIDDETEGYAFLLQLVFDDLATDLPGLFGDVGVTRLFPIPAKALRDAVETLDDPDLASAWTDDVTLGWVYQYWNDPDREALDAKLKARGKLLPYEIASKTQMFTERYMVEWLLQNSLGLTWLCMCKKHDWTADAERILPVLDERRADWRRKRDASEVELDALMPIDGELEKHWKYYVPQPLPDDAISSAPESVKSIKLLDPACGSGHFLVIAFDHLAALYQEEARHRSTSITDRAISESILENNLHGIDIDPRAIQIAAASLYLKAKTFSKEARPRRLNLVAPTLQLGNLATDDPAVVQLRDDLKREAALPEELTNKLLSSLAGVDYLGSLLKVDAAVEDTLRAADEALRHASQRSFIFASDDPDEEVVVEGTGPDALLFLDQKANVLDQLERFLERHSSSEDLGLRLGGEQLAAGVRFVRMAKEGTYDLVVGNPPYQGISKTQSFGYVTTTYPNGKADLYAAFLERALDLARKGGLSALLTMRSWMFIGQFAELRKRILHDVDLRSLGDVDRGAFEDVPDEVLATTMSVIRHGTASGWPAVALQPTPPDDRSRDSGRTARKRAAILAHVGRYDFDPRRFEVVEGEPIVYWWSNEFLKRYAEAPKLGHVAPVRQGVGTRDNTRFIRRPWEIHRESLQLSEFPCAGYDYRKRWVPVVMGAAGQQWCEPVGDCVNWKACGLEIATFSRSRYGRGAQYYFQRGVAVTVIGNSFAARLHTRPSIISDAGVSAFAGRADIEPRDLVCQMNSSTARRVVESLNPTVNFKIYDVSRIPLLGSGDVSAFSSQLLDSFAAHEAAREPSVEFRRPAPSAWRYAQEWAQRSVDRPQGTPVPDYKPVPDPPDSESVVSFAIGVALGRFDEGGNGLLDEAPPTALPAGILFVSSEGSDSLNAAPCARIHDAWNDRAKSDGKIDDLPNYLRSEFFAYHKKLYESRPIYFPLSSAKKSFVAYISIHRWSDDTLSVLLADHLMPAKKRLEGELDDLRTAKVSEKNKANQRHAEKRFTEAQKLLEELNQFIARVTDIAEHGPPPPEDTTTKREVDARFTMDLDDGVMVNSSALWPLLEPLWRQPRTWWTQLANAEDKTDYDWSHLAARYFPTRVRRKCHDDPSLAVAHGCFWELHPEKAYAWELRLQDEIKPDFTIDEPGSDAARKQFLSEHAARAREIEQAEAKRRERKAAKEEESDEPLFDGDSDEAEDDADD